MGLLEGKDLQVGESAFTGDSLCAEKVSGDSPTGKHGVADASNGVFTGIAVRTGIGNNAVIVCTGRNTAFGDIAQRLATRPPKTEFGCGIRHFGPETMPMIISVMLAIDARRMTKKKVLADQLSAIEDFGSIEIRCSDKTGTR